MESGAIRSSCVKILPFVAMAAALAVAAPAAASGTHKGWAPIATPSSPKSPSSPSSPASPAFKPFKGSSTYEHRTGQQPYQYGARPKPYGSSVFGPDSKPKKPRKY
jgi:hypothetical protein